MDQKAEQIMRDDPRSSNDNRERIPVATVKGPTVPKQVSFSEKLREARPSKKIVAALMMATAVLTMLVGFNYGGWVTGGTSQQRVDTGAQDAVALRLVPICVAQFNSDPQQAPKLAELKAITSSWERPDYVKKQGWATMPGEQTPDNDVAAACTKLLMGS
jgi:hypothetical protein